MVNIQFQGAPNQYKVSLTLSKSDIDLVRFSWNLMLSEDEASVYARPDRSTFSSLPGSFPDAPNQFQDQQSSRGSMNTTTSVLMRSQSSVMATSLFCRQFFANLVARDQGLEKLLPSIKHQAVAFASLLSLIVGQLEDLSGLDAYLFQLGKRHARILNVEPVHFELMGEALIQTFHERFGARFNQELEILWIKLYLYLANSLLQYGIDPAMDYESYQNNLPSSINSRQNSIAEDVFSYDSRSSQFTQNTSKSMFYQNKVGANTVPVSPVPSFLTSLVDRATPKRMSKVSTPPRQAPPNPLQPVPGNSMIEPRRRKRDCIIM